MTLAGPAQAQTSQSGGSITLRLIVPPLGAVAAAARTGAVGHWTVNSLEGGFMIRIPSELPVDGISSVALFAGRQILFTTDTGADSPLVLTASGRNNVGGLYQTELRVQSRPAAKASVHGVPIYIRGI